MFMVWFSYTPGRRTASTAVTSCALWLTVVMVRRHAPPLASEACRARQAVESSVAWRGVGVVRGEKEEA